MKSVALLLLLAALTVCVRAQIPSLGFCPEYISQADLDLEKFAGVWYEAERYFQLTEVASRCVMSNYTKGPDNRYHVINEVTSRFTGIKRVLEGEVRKVASKSEWGKLHIKYNMVPLIPLETAYTVLETDYDSYAVLWSCTGVGPVHTQNAWIMTRDRLAPGETLQKAYGVLDKYKISKVFFVKTNQEDCAYLDSIQENKPTEPPKKTTSPAPPQASAEDEEANNEQPQPLTKSVERLTRPHITPDAPELIVRMRTAELKQKAELKKKAEEQAMLAEAMKLAVVKQAAIKQPAVEAIEPIAPIAPIKETVKTVPEIIMEVADQAKEAAKESAKELVKETAEPLQELKEEAVSAAAAVVAAVAEEPKEPIAALPVAALPIADTPLQEEKIKPEPEKKLDEDKKIEKEAIRD